MTTEEFVDVVVDPAADAAEGAVAPKVDTKVAPPKKDDVVVVKADDPPAKVLEPEEGLEILKGKLQASELARQDAERRVRESAATVVQAKTEVQDTNLQLVVNAMETVKQSQEALKAKYREARAAGDVELELEVQGQMQTNAARMLQLEQGKVALEKQPKPVAPRQADPVEQLASQLTPRSADWVRRNPQFARDERLYQKMLGAHNIAMADGFTADSDEYFSAIEETLKVKRADPVLQQSKAADDPTAGTAQVVQRRSSPPAAAPVSRNGNGDGSRPNTVRLTSAEIEMAGLMNMTPVEYARNKLALKNEGKINEH